MDDDTGRPLDGTQVEAPATQAAGRRGASPALWFGVALVFLGTLLLVSQFVPGMDLWRWWPLIVVALGLRQCFGPRASRWSVRHLGDGLTTIAVGLVLLGQMLGALRWDVWLNILRLWPVLLVSLGLEIIGKATRVEALRFLGSLVVVAALAFGALVLTPQVGWPPVTRAGSGEAFDHVERHRDAVKEGSATIAGGVGELSVRAGNDLVQATGSSPYDPTFDVSTRGGKATVDVSAGEGSWMPMTPASDLAVTLDHKVEWDLDIKAGVSEYEVDLSEIEVASLALESGVSSGVLTLGDPGASGARGPVPVEIGAGVSAITIRVPRSASTRVTIDAGLSGVESEGEWQHDSVDDERTYESDGFSDARAYWDVRIDSGIGGITLRYY